MRITFGSNVRTINHKPITLRNATVLQEWASKCIAHAKAANENEVGKTFVAITKDYPELLRLIDTNGTWNVQTLNQRVEARRKQHEQACKETGEDTPFDETEYRQRIVKEMQNELQAIIRDTPMIAKLLHFTTPKFPEDLESLTLGIQCIKSVANENDLTGISEDDWLDVSAAEVAEWINNFCSKVGK